MHRTTHRRRLRLLLIPNGLRRRLDLMVLPRHRHATQRTDLIRLLHHGLRTQHLRLVHKRVLGHVRSHSSRHHDCAGKWLDLLVAFLAFVGACRAFLLGFLGCGR